MILWIILWFIIGLIGAFLLKATNYLQYNLDSFELSVRDIIDIIFSSFLGFFHFCLILFLLYSKFKVLDKVIIKRKK